MTFESLFWKLFLGRVLDNIFEFLEGSWACPGEFFFVVFETLGHVGWKGGQDRGKGGIPKVVPPLLLEGTLEPEVVQFPIDSGISFDMAIIGQNTLLGWFF